MVRFMSPTSYQTAPPRTMGRSRDGKVSYLQSRISASDTMTGEVIHVLSTTTGRTFIALPLPPSVADVLEGAADSLRERLDGRFVPRERLHLTLAFIGPLIRGGYELAALPQLIDKVASRHEPVKISLDSWGSFGRPVEAALWWGIQEPEPAHALAADLRVALTEAGIPFDTKPFRPHITVARRVRIDAEVLDAVARDLRGTEGSSDQVVLFESVNEGGAHTYRPLHVANLTA